MTLEMGLYLFCSNSSNKLHILSGEPIEHHRGGNMKTRLLSVEEAAFYLGVQKSTIYSWAWRRKIPSVKMGRRLLFDREDLDRIIEERKRGVEPSPDQEQR